MPRVSVLMGIYNCAPTLLGALESLDNQTYKDFQIILCEDGSKDNTIEIAKEYASTHGNVVLLVNEKNMGLNYTLNRCLDCADTEYVARMDGDDFSLPERFEKEVAFLDSHPDFAIVSSAMVRFNENGNFLVDTPIEYPSKKDLIRGCPISHPACMVRTKAMKEVGGYTVDKKLLRMEDYHLWVKMYAAGYKAYNIPEPLYRFRDDENAYKRRNWMGRKNEMHVVNIGVKALGFPWYYSIYALRPLIAHIVPRWVYNVIHQQRGTRLQ